MEWSGGVWRRPRGAERGGATALQETAEPVLSAGPDALLKEKTKQKRQREGYEEGISTTARPASAASFLASEKPVEALGRFTRCRPLGPRPSPLHPVALAVKP